MLDNTYRQTSKIHIDKQAMLDSIYRQTSNVR